LIFSVGRSVTGPWFSPAGRGRFSDRAQRGVPLPDGEVRGTPLGRPGVGVGLPTPAQPRCGATPPPRRRRYGHRRPVLDRPAAPVRPVPAPVSPQDQPQHRRRGHRPGTGRILLGRNDRRLNPPPIQRPERTALEELSPMCSRADATPVGAVTARAPYPTTRRDTPWQERSPFRLWPAVTAATAAPSQGQHPAHSPHATSTREHQKGGAPTRCAPTRRGHPPRPPPASRPTRVLPTSRRRTIYPMQRSRHGRTMTRAQIHLPTPIQTQTHQHNALLTLDRAVPHQTNDTPIFHATSPPTRRNQPG